MFSSASRPIINMRPDYRMWLNGSGRALSAEMYLFEWLERRGLDFDVISDFELHTHGAAALTGTRAVITGSHPEYYSDRMLRALHAYRDEGGGLLYLGGNGFYWVTEVYSTTPLITEVRRGHSGIRAWESAAGELTLISTGQPGGLWRHRGRAPQSLVGVGFAAQGWGQSEPYQRTDAGRSPSVAWIFEGVDEDPVGAYGRVMGGAAGDELDRVDASLGTPPGAVVLARSGNHTNYYQRVIEECGMIFHASHGGQSDPEVHADMVYFKTPKGGQVFSAGSIAWTGALLENDCKNGISRITENVILRFVAP
jgi:N,N-dimethylformamidase